MGQTRRQIVQGDMRNYCSDDPDCNCMYCITICNTHLDNMLGFLHNVRNARMLECQNFNMLQNVLKTRPV